MHERHADEWKEEKKEALKLLEKQREERKKVLDEIGKAAKVLIECSQDKQNIKEAAVAGLNQAEKGLKYLSTVMRDAAIFWTAMEVIIVKTIYI